MAVEEWINTLSMPGIWLEHWSRGSESREREWKFLLAWDHFERCLRDHLLLENIHNKSSHFQWVWGENESREMGLRWLKGGMPKWTIVLGKSMIQSRPFQEDLFQKECSSSPRFYLGQSRLGEGSYSHHR
jgi:hypothetical protein